MTSKFWRDDDIPLSWSEATGCFERQLQRRHNNALFPPTKRRVTTAELVQAQSRDRADLERLRSDTQEFIDGIGIGPTPVLSAKDIHRLSDETLKLAIRAAAVGNIADSLGDRLRAVYEHLVGILRENCPPEVKAPLEEGNATYERYLKTFSNQFVAQFQRDDTPISEADLLPSLLVEDVQTVRLLASMMPSEMVMAWREAGAVLVANAKKEGYMLPHAADKLRALDKS